jgi:hypothetical protein
MLLVAGLVCYKEYEMFKGDWDIARNKTGADNWLILDDQLHELTITKKLPLISNVTENKSDLRKKADRFASQAMPPISDYKVLPLSHIMIYISINTFQDFQVFKQMKRH